MYAYIMQMHIMLKLLYVTLLYNMHLLHANDSVL